MLTGFNSHKNTMSLLARLIILPVFLAGCTGSMEDLASLEKSKGVGSGSGSTTSPSSPDGSNSDGSDGGGNSGDGGTDGSGGSGGGSGDGGSGDGSGTAAPPPEVTILNINSPYLRGGINQEILFRVVSRVGAVSQIEYVVSCPSAGAVPNDSITTGDAPNSASAVTIQRNVVSIGAGEDTSVIWDTPSLPQVLCLRTDGSLETALNSFKIRITTIGENNQSLTVESAEFQIDSEAPSFQDGGITCPSGQCIAGGVTQIEISGLSDNLTPVDSICLKMDDSTVPTKDHSCWRPLSTLGASTAPPFSATNPGNFILQYFLGYFAFSSEFYFWVKDGAGNISQLSNSNVGTLAKDRLTVSSNGTSKIANSDPTFMSTADGLYHETNASEGLAFTVAPAGIKKYLESDSNYVTYAPDTYAVSLDPTGQTFIRDATKGLLKVSTTSLEDSPATNIKSVVIPQTGTFTEGTLASGSVSFKALKKHAIDSKGFHWFLDDNKLSFVDFSSPTPTLTHVAGGGNDETSDEFLDPKALKINSGDNIDTYGVFVVLPNQWVVFSADDPTLPLNPASGPRFKLRVYKHSATPSERRISTVYLSGSTSQGSTDNMVPYGILAANYDSTRNSIKHITGRFCDITPGTGGAPDSCTSAKLIRFSISISGNPEYLGSTIKDSFLSFKYLDDTLYMIDATKGTLNIWNSTAFQKLAGSTARGSSYCNNMSVATSCALRLIDFSPIPNGRDQVLIRDQNYLRILEQGQIFSIYSAL